MDGFSSYRAGGDDLRTSKSFNMFSSISKKMMTFATPGVGEYQPEKVDVRKRSPVCAIGNSMRFNRTSTLL